MIPLPVHCSNCGGFTGEHRMCSTDSALARMGKHKSLEDCVDHLNKKLTMVLEELHEKYLLEYDPDAYNDV